MKSAHVFAICVVATLVLGSSSFAEAAEGEYDYTNGPLGQANWGNLPGAELCKTGLMQSPMRINPSNTRRDENLDELETSVPEGKIPASISNTKKTIEVGLKGLKLKINKTTYESAQFHIHYPSEHVISGKEYPLELHLVHFSATGEIAVIAYFFFLGAPSTFFDQFIHKLPDAGKLNVPIDGGIEFTLTNGIYGRYMGSLTTPPCSENVIWTLNTKNIFSISSLQLEKLKEKFPRNDRDVQNPNGRILRVSKH